jgi:predicted ThiF/HesA family dinucleotide-utilizing enzyme
MDFVAPPGQLRQHRGGVSSIAGFAEGAAIDDDDRIGPKHKQIRAQLLSSNGLFPRQPLGVNRRGFDAIPEFIDRDGQHLELQVQLP